MTTMTMIHVQYSVFPGDFFRTQEEADAHIERTNEINPHHDPSGWKVETVERESHPCKLCGREVTSNNPEKYPYCRGCHYTGAAATEIHMNDLLPFRIAFDDATVDIEHTGGGCFWLAFHWPGEHVYYAATNGEAGLPEDDQWADGWGIVCRYYYDPDDEENSEQHPDFEGTIILEAREAYDPDVQGYTVAEVIEAIRADRHRS